MKGEQVMKQRLIIILSCLFVSVALMAQHKVTGTIVDSDGEPAIGASVIEKGNPKNGTVAAPRHLASPVRG